jgi:hypothetical protein
MFDVKWIQHGPLPPPAGKMAGCRSAKRVATGPVECAQETPKLHADHSVTGAHGALGGFLSLQPPPLLAEVLGLEDVARIRQRPLIY